MTMAESLAEAADPSALLNRLLERVEQVAAAVGRLEKTAAEVPNLAGIAADTFDDWAAGMVGQGIDLEKAARQGLHAALWLGQRVSEPELERLGILLRSDVLDPHALATIGKLGRAMATCHEGACDVPSPGRLGPVGLLRALSDPDVQRALAFVVQVARCFGSQLADGPRTLA